MVQVSNLLYETLPRRKLSFIIGPCCVKTSNPQTGQNCGVDVTQPEMIGIVYVKTTNFIMKSRKYCHQKYV